MQQQTIHIKQEEKKIWDILSNVTDPEVPVLTILDLGIVREVAVNDGGIEISITPTYSGCPAMDMIAANIRMELLAAGYEHIVIKNVLSPAWTTEWISEAGKQKLKAYGIAPPYDLNRLFATMISLRPTKRFNARNATLIIPNASANLAAPPANRCINAWIAKSRSIISNAISYR